VVICVLARVFLPLAESTKAALRAAIFIFIIKYQHGIFARTNTWGGDAVAYACILLADNQRERGDVPGVHTSENTLDFQTTRAKHDYFARNGVHVEGANF
jgi:hypothetical protein